VILQATLHVPHERYERTCGGCGWNWSIDRTTTRDRDGIRIDTLDWEKSAAH